MPSYGDRLGGGAVCPLRRGVASSETEMNQLLEGRSATLERGRDVSCSRESRGEPSSEAELSHLFEGRSTTLEWGGDCPAGLRGTLERGGDRSAGSRGIRMGRTLGFLSPLLFSRLEGGRGPSWAQLP